MHRCMKSIGSAVKERKSLKASTQGLNGGWNEFKEAETPARNLVQERTSHGKSAKDQSPNSQIHTYLPNDKYLLASSSVTSDLRRAAGASTTAIRKPATYVATYHS
jgi:hypothetical protein